MILHEIILVIIGIGLFTLINDEILALKNFTRGDKNNFAGPQKGPQGSAEMEPPGGIFAVLWGFRRNFRSLAGFLQVGMMQKLRLRLHFCTPFLMKYKEKYGGMCYGYRCPYQRY